MDDERQRKRILRQQQVARTQSRKTGDDEDAQPDTADETDEEDERERKRQIDQKRLAARGYLRDQIKQRTATAAGSAAQQGAKSLTRRLMARIIGRSVIGITARLLVIGGGSCIWYLFIFVIIATIGYIFTHPIETITIVIGAGWEGLKNLIGGFFSAPTPSK